MHSCSRYKLWAEAYELGKNVGFSLVYAARLNSHCCHDGTGCTNLSCKIWRMQEYWHRSILGFSYQKAIFSWCKESVHVSFTWFTASETSDIYESRSIRKIGSNPEAQTPSILTQMLQWWMIFKKLGSWRINIEITCIDRNMMRFLVKSSQSYKHNITYWQMLRNWLAD